MTRLNQLLLAAAIGAVIDALLPAKTPGIIHTAVSLVWMVCLALAVALLFGFLAR